MAFETQTKLQKNCWEEPLDWSPRSKEFDQNGKRSGAYSQPKAEQGLWLWTREGWERAI